MEFFEMQAVKRCARRATHTWKEGLARRGTKVSAEAEKKYYKAYMRDYQLRLENPLPPRGPRGCEMNYKRMQVLGEARHRESVRRKKQE